MPAAAGRTAFLFDDAPAVTPPITTPAARAPPADHPPRGQRRDDASQGETPGARTHSEPRAAPAHRFLPPFGNGADVSANAGRVKGLGGWSGGQRNVSATRTRGERCRRGSRRARPTTAARAARASPP